MSRLALTYGVIPGQAEAEGAPQLEILHGSNCEVGRGSQVQGCMLQPAHSGHRPV